MLGPNTDSDNCYYSQHFSNGLFILEVNSLLIVMGKKCWNFISVLMKIVPVETQLSLAQSHMEIITLTR